MTPFRLLLASTVATTALCLLRCSQLTMATPVPTSDYSSVLLQWNVCHYVQSAVLFGADSDTPSWSVVNSSSLLTSPAHVDPTGAAAPYCTALSVSGTRVTTLTDASTLDSTSSLAVIVGLVDPYSLQGHALTLDGELSPVTNSNNTTRTALRYIVLAQ